MNVKNKNEIYKCNVCGNMVETLHVGAGELICCGQPMELKIENTQEAAIEKHIPIIEKIATGIRVKVGEVTHPMEEAHYIEWIEVISNGKSYKKFINPGDAPEAVFCLENTDDIMVREYCNIHGLWKNS